MFARNRNDSSYEDVPADGVVTGYGEIDGRKVYVYAQDFTSMGGTMAEMQSKKICNLMDSAVKVGCPIIAFNDSGGARIQDGVDSLAVTVKSSAVIQASASSRKSALFSVRPPAAVFIHRH